MIKMLCMMSRKKGMSRADFKAYYEANHVPLVERLLPFYVKYSRNFVCDVQDYQPAHVDNHADNEPEFDVVTSLTFESQAMYQKMVDALADPEIGGQIARDEENFFDRDAMRIYLVEEHRSA